MLNIAELTGYLCALIDLIRQNLYSMRSLYVAVRWSGRELHS